MATQDFRSIGTNVQFRLTDLIDTLIAQKNFQMSDLARGKLQLAIDAIQDGKELVEEWYEETESKG